MLIVSGYAAQPHSQTPDFLALSLPTPRKQLLVWNPAGSHPFTFVSRYCNRTLSD
jgi:hypothetical protein